LQELGIYSRLFIDVSATGKDLIKDHLTFGHLLRTKSAESDEGGVVAGFSVVDQPYITSEIGPLNPSIRIKPLIEDF
jgi:hypothetical protein